MSAERFDDAFGLCPPDILFPVSLERDYATNIVGF
jgi:hypothetical protein